MILIQGAGIAGLSLAGLLEQQGMEYLVVERCSRLEPLGAGLVLQRNALAVLAFFGTGRLDGVSRALTAMCVGTAAEPMRQRVALDRSTRARGIHRGALQTFLLEQISADRLKLGRTVAAWKRTSAGLDVTLDDGERVQCTVLVGADGIESAIRSQLAGPARIRDTDQWCARTIIAGCPSGDCAIEIHAGRSRLGVVPLTDNRAYVFWVRSSHPGQALDVREVAADIGGLGSLGTAIADHLEPNQLWLQHRLRDIPICWGDGPVALIGDAAHALTPNLGQGAALGIEDAYTLCRLLLTTDVDGLAERLAEMRHTRIAKIRSASFNAGRIAHLRAPVPRLLRDLALKVVPGPVVARGLGRWLDEFAREPEARLRMLAGGAQTAF